VRFLRMAERRIVEGTGAGVICYISNYSWLDGLSFTAMREKFLSEFDRIWIDNLNGDRYKTGKLTPQGAPDPSIFSTEWNPEGIQVGTAITTLVRRPNHQPSNTVRFRHLWGRQKRAELLADASATTPAVYQEVTPLPELGLPFMPLRSEAGYIQWPLLPDLLPTAFPGVKTSRDDVVVDIDRDRLVARMQRYFDPAISHHELRGVMPRAMTSTGRFQAEATRDALLRRGYLPDNVVAYCYRPFDLRWLYWEPETKLLEEKRTEYFPHVFAGNVWLSAGQRNRKADFYQPQVTGRLADYHIVESNAGMFPLYLKPAARQTPRQMALLALQQDEPDAPGAGPTANLSPAARGYLAALEGNAEDLFYHVVAVLHAPAYREENAGALRQDWPRVPLPATRETLRASAELGRQVAALLDIERPVDGVTSGTIREELLPLGSVSRVGAGQLNPDVGDLALTAGWGHGGKGSATMPGQGQLQRRPYGPTEQATPPGLAPEALYTLLGHTTLDVYLNDVAYWRNVPARVWEYTIGGYQVIKKWLSYRERDLLGRSLSLEDARYVQGMVRRIAAILLLGPLLDASYAATKAAPHPWPTNTATALPGPPMAAPDPLQES